ncbi:MAG: N-formylglutamate amidohydrolase [Alphaproteobacteria bacterium]
MADDGRDDAPDDAARIVGAARSGGLVVLCDHASNRLPAAYGTLGLGPDDLARHIAWDPGALAVAERLAAAIDGPLVHATWSRLLADCNRDAADEDLIVTVSEDTPIPGNAQLSAAERQGRIARFHAPYHRAVTALCDDRAAAGRLAGLVALHSFTPVYRGVPRPWHVGVIHDDDMRLAGPVLAALTAEAGLVVGDNRPYAPSDRVYRTLERHAAARGLPAVMIEIRNDLVAEETGVAAWADRLARALRPAAAGPSSSGAVPAAGAVPC